MKKLNSWMIIGFLIAVFVTAISGQTITAPDQKTVKTESQSLNYVLLIENEDGHQTKLGPTDLAKLKRQTVKVTDHGQEATFEGVALVEALKLGGIEFGETLRGKRLATFLLVEARDQYAVVFALPEFDSGFTDKIVLLADRRDGQPLSKTEGELRLVIPDEKKPARWVRQVVSLKIVRATTALANK